MRGDGLGVSPHASPIGPQGEVSNSDCHHGKGLKELIAPHVNDAYNVGVPTDQHGATAGRGTDFATLVVRLFIEHCLGEFV